MYLTAHTWASASIILMTGLVVFMDWVPTPLNRNIGSLSVRERVPSTIVHATLGLVFAAANFFVAPWVIFAGAIWYSIVLFAAIRNWWIPYFVGVHKGEITPEIFTAHYADNLSVLPRLKGNPIIPDVQHMLIHLTVLGAGLLSWWSFRLA